MTIFAVVLLLFAFITVIGHLVWLACARLLGFRTLTVPANAIASKEVCRHCGRGAISIRPARVDAPPIPFAARAALQEAESEAAPVEIKPPPIPLTPAPLAVVPTAPPIPSRPAEPRRSLSSIVSAFMEERNIRWGELVGGLLIVGCSIALVISFWAEISRQPFLRFAAMTGVTTALFGLGLYSEHRWKLPTTSRGILVIATLLTPLNCLAFAAFSGSASPALLGCELMSVVLFALLLWAAARVIAPQWPGLLTFGTAGLAASLLIIRFLRTPPTLSHASSLLILAALPIGSELLPCAVVLGRTRRRRFIHGSAAEAIFLLLGILSFGTILAIGLIVHGAPQTRWALAQLASLIVIAAAPLLAGGAILHGRIKRARFVHLRVAATAVAILGAGVVLAAVGLGWPGAQSMLAAAASAFLIFVLIAWLEKVPVLHLAGGLCLALAWLLGFHLLRHDLNWQGSSAQMLSALSDPANALALLPLLIVIALATEWKLRREAAATSRIGLILIALLGAIGVGLVSWKGFGIPGDPHHAIWIYLSYGIGCLLIAIRDKREPFAWAGWLLIAAFFAQLFLTRLHPDRPWETALLLFASVSVLADWLAGRPVALATSPSPLGEGWGEGNQRFDEDPHPHPLAGGRPIRSLLPEYREREQFPWRPEISRVIARVARPASPLGVAASAIAAILLTMSLWPQAPTFHLLWLSAIWFAVAVRESSRLLLFITQCVVHLAVTLAFLSDVNAAWHVIKARDFVHATQINSILFTAFAVLWNLAGRLEWVRTKRDALLRGLPRIDLACGVGLNAVLALSAAAMLALAPNLVGVDYGATVGGSLGWAALLSASAALLAAMWNASERRRANAVGIIAVTGSALIGLSAASFTHDGWVGFHVLVVANLMSAWGIALWGLWGSRFSIEPAIVQEMISAEMNVPLSLSAEQNNVVSYSRPEKFAQGTLQAVTNRWACAFAFIVVCLAVRGMAGDALRAIWSVTPVVMISLLFAGMASWNLQRSFLFAFGLTLNLAATLWFIANPLNLPSLSVLDFANVNAIVLDCAGLATLVVELHLFRPNRQFVPGAWPSFHDAAAFGSLIVSVIATGTALLGTMQGETTALNPMIFAIALAATIICVIGRMWDSTSRLPIVAIYATGLVIVAAIAAQSHFSPRIAVWLGSILLSCYTLLTAWLWRSRAGLIDVARRLGCEISNVRDFSSSWLGEANSVLAVSILVAGAWVVLTFAEFPFRLGAAAAVALQFVALGLLASKQKNTLIRELALAMGLFGAIFCACAAMSIEATIFQRMAVVLVVVGGWLVMSSIASSRRWISESWSNSVKQNLQLAGALAGMAMLTTLVREVEVITAGGRPMIGNFTMVVIASSFAAGCALAITFAVRGRTTAAPLSDRARAAYVYLGELLLALLFLHVRLSRPHWFGRFEPWWPLIVMGIAFAGAAIGEMLRRTARQIIAEPMHRTALFLPLLPTFGFWLLPNRVDLSLLILTISVLYGLMSLVRRSTQLALLAGLAANLALWSELQRTPGTGFFEHPQLWLIPMGFLIFAAGESNRRRLNVENLRLIRYLALSIIYLSSTADIFLNGVARAPWLPLVLAVISIGGVLAGVSFRIKPLLFLGVWFLGVSVLTMIYYASQSLQWTWIWYVAGIALGGFIILVFALFEKKRTHVLAMVDALRKWE